MQPYISKTLKQTKRRTEIALVATAQLVSQSKHRLPKKRSFRKEVDKEQRGTSECDHCKLQHALLLEPRPIAWFFLFSLHTFLLGQLCHSFNILSTGKTAVNNFCKVLGPLTYIQQKQFEPVKSIIQCSRVLREPERWLTSGLPARKIWKSFPAQDDCFSPGRVRE